MATISFKNVIFMMHSQLSLSTSTTHLSVSVSASSSPSSFAVDYLTNKCGLPLKSAIATSKKLHFNDNNIQRSDDVINLFKYYGFDDTHISKIIQRNPLVLNRCRIDENLKPKLEYLVESGFSGPLLHDLIVSSPRLLGTSLTHKIKPSLDFLRSFLGSEDRLKLAVKRNSRLLTNNLKATLQPNVELLLKEGVPLDALTNFLVSYPNLMQPKVDRLISALEMAKDVLKMRATDPKFLLAVLTIAAVGVSLCEKKLQVFNSFGFPQEVVLPIFKRYPQCMSFSEETLGTKLSFYFDTVKLKRGDIISYPALLGYAIETRIRPRHNVLKILLSKKLLKEDAKIAYLFSLSEDKFLKKYVTEHLQQLPGLLEMYNNDSAVNRRVFLIPKANIFGPSLKMGGVMPSLRSAASI